jgi:DNA repair exonuclease SbcCD nuclease subunit
MDYWALGHIHKHEVLSTEPYAVYAGSPQGLNPKETGAHGCCVVTLGRHGVVAFEHLDLAPVVWESLSIDTSVIETLDGVERALRGAFDEVRERSGRPVVVRARLVGRTSVHRELIRPGVRVDLMRMLQEELMAGSPWAWIDRLGVATTPDVDVNAWLESPEFIGEVARTAAALSDDQATLEAMLEEIVAPLAQKLGSYRPGMSSDELLRAARDRALGELVMDADGGGR